MATTLFSLFSPAASKINFLSHNGIELPLALKKKFMELITFVSFHKHEALCGDFFFYHKIPKALTT